MSATLGNIKDLQTFLGAENYTNNFRPVSDSHPFHVTFRHRQPFLRVCCVIRQILSFFTPSQAKQLEKKVTEIKNSCSLKTPSKKIMFQIKNLSYNVHAILDLR